jgi:hypothetical protein
MFEIRRKISLVPDFIRLVQPFGRIRIDEQARKLLPSPDSKLQLRVRSTVIGPPMLMFFDCVVHKLLDIIAGITVS